MFQPESDPRIGHINYKRTYSTADRENRVCLTTMAHIHLYFYCYVKGGLRGKDQTIGNLMFLSTSIFQANGLIARMFLPDPAVSVYAFASGKLSTKTPSNTWEKLFLKVDFFKNNLKKEEIERSFRLHRTCSDSALLKCTR